MKRLFVLSLDSLFYDDMEWIKDAPYLYDILQRGSQIKRVKSEYPAMTYTAHTTMLTGCHVDVHGIYHNEKVEIDKQYPDWHWRREEIKVPTLVDYAVKEGYRFCVVNWPVSGADPNIEFNIPEIWAETTDGDSRPRFLTVCSPGIEKLFDKYRYMLRWKYQPELDEFGVCCLTEVIEEHQPEVIMLHLSYLDHTRHRQGGFSEAAKMALIECDKRLGRLVEQLKRLGVYDETNFVVVGDHGHMPVKQVFNPNVIFRNKGLIELDENGLVKNWKVYCHSAGLSAHIVLKDPNDEEVRKQVLEIMNEMVADESLGCEQILDKKTFNEVWHLDGPFDYVIEGRPGTSFGNRCVEPMIIDPDNRDYKISVSAHGHMPTKGPQPTFFMAGPQIKQGVVIENCEMIDEAPTWLAILGIDMPSAQGRAYKELLNEQTD